MTSAWIWVYRVLLPPSKDNRESLTDPFSFPLSILSNPTGLSLALMYVFRSYGHWNHLTIRCESLTSALTLKNKNTETYQREYVYLFKLSIHLPDYISRKTGPACYLNLDIFFNHAWILTLSVYKMTLRRIIKSPWGVTFILYTSCKMTSWFKKF